jgi:hypothetical protein
LTRSLEVKRNSPSPGNFWRVDAYFINRIAGNTISKRLKPEQQIAPLGLQYDRTKTLCRTAAPPGLIANRAIIDQRRDEPEMTL